MLPSHQDEGTRTVPVGEGSADTWGRDGQRTHAASNASPLGGHSLHKYFLSHTLNESRRKQSVKEMGQACLLHSSGHGEVERHPGFPAGPPPSWPVTLMESFGQPLCASVSKSELPGKKETYFLGLFLRDTTQQGLGPPDVVTM